MAARIFLEVYAGSVLLLDLTEAMVVEKWDTAYMWNLRLGLQVE